MWWIGLALAAAPAPAPAKLCAAATEAGWRVAGEALVAPERRPLDYTTHPGALDGLERVLAALKDRDIRVVVLLLPDRTHALDGPHTGGHGTKAWNADEAAYQDVLTWLRERAALAPDVAALARRLDATGTPFFRPDDGHWTVEGSLAAAAEVASLLRADRPWTWLGSTPQDLVPAKFASERPGKEAVQLAALCGGEPKPLYRGATYQLTSPPVDSSALLADLPPPPVAVVGSSFVEPFFYFPQALAADLDAEVAALAVAGGGMTTPLRAWLGGTDLDRSRPDVLVWVISATHAFRAAASHAGSLQSFEGYRQLLPAFDGGCRDETTVAKLPVGADGTLLSPGGDAIPTVGHYLQLEGGGVGNTTFYLHFKYSEGTTERLKIVPDERLDARPYTAVEFAPLEGARVVGIRVETVGDASLGDARARVCRRRDVVAR